MRDRTPAPRYGDAMDTPTLVPWTPPQVVTLVAAASAQVSPGTVGPLTSVQ